MAVKRQRSAAAGAAADVAADATVETTASSSQQQDQMAVVGGCFPLNELLISDSCAPKRAEIQTAVSSFVFQIIILHFRLQRQAT